ncbi:hypothetical protein C3L33_20534, partial [Rhododendron williamsianum]
NGIFSKCRMWEFSVGLYMIDIWPNSLLLAAVYGVVESGSTALFGPLVGHLIDRLTYLKILQLWLLTQNLSFMVAGGTVVALVVNPDLKSTNYLAFLSLVIVTNISGALGTLSTLAGTILIEREWAVVISEGQPPEVLTQLNSVIRRIDLTCKLGAPVVTGFIISFVSLEASALTLSLWNILSVFLQYWLLMSVYNGIPSLGERNQKRAALRLSPVPEESPSTSQEQTSLLPLDANYSESSNSSWTRKIIERFSKSPYIVAWRVYLRQDVVLPGVALALLYFTVLRLTSYGIDSLEIVAHIVYNIGFGNNLKMERLPDFHPYSPIIVFGLAWGCELESDSICYCSFGTLMTATLEWEGIPAYVIGIARGVSAAIGIAATYLYPIVQSRISTIRTGIWSIWSQWAFLLVCVASIWVKNDITSAYLLMAGVAASRLGLWMFDLSVIQQMQDQVPESDRMVVGGVQNSLQSVLDLMTYVMAVVISNPQVIMLVIICFV